MALINIYCNNYDEFLPIENNTFFLYIYLYYFSMNAVFHVKIESMPLK